MSEWRETYFAQLVALAGEYTVDDVNFFAEDPVQFGIADEFIADDDFVVLFFLVLEAVLLKVLATKALDGASE